VASAPGAARGNRLGAVKAVTIARFGGFEVMLLRVRQ
jgi:hypothetical protein